MSSYLTEAEELRRQYDVAQHLTHHRPTAPRSGVRAPRRRRVASGLRRVADRLDP